MKNQVQENKEFNAPEFNVKDWVDANGNKTDQVKLSDFKGKFKVVYGFQSWCPRHTALGFLIYKNGGSIKR